MIRHRVRARLASVALVVAIGLVALTLMPAPSALAHAVLVRSSPAPESRLEQAEPSSCQVIACSPAPMLSAMK